MIGKGTPSPWKNASRKDRSKGTPETVKKAEKTEKAKEKPEEKLTEKTEKAKDKAEKRKGKSEEKPTEKTEKEKQPEGTELPPEGARPAKVIAGEVIKRWQSTSRGKGTEGEVMRKPELLWWHSMVQEEHEKKMELSGKLMLLFEIIRMCEQMGDKV